MKSKILLSHRDFAKNFGSIKSVDEAMREVCEQARRLLGCCRVDLVWEDEECTFTLSSRDSQAAVGPDKFNLPRSNQSELESLVTEPIFINDTSRSFSNPAAAQIFEDQGILSVGILPVFEGDSRRGLLICLFASFYHQFSLEEKILLSHLVEYGALCVTNLKIQKAQAALLVSRSTSRRIEKSEDKGIRQQRELEYRRLVEYSNLLIIRTDAELNIQDVQGNTHSILGVGRANLLLEQLNIWSKFLHPVDLSRLARRVREVRRKPREIKEDIRVRNAKTGELRWLILKAIPLFGAEGDFIGWEGFGLDVTEKRVAEDELKRQGKRIEALYEIARSLQFHMDPVMVALKGLKSVMAAIESDAGLVCLYNDKEGAIEISASEGLSPEYLATIESTINGDSLVRYVIESKEGLIIKDIQNDPRATVSAAQSEGLHATIFMPFIFEKSVLGVIVLFRRDLEGFDEADLELLGAASNQLALACKQAELYSAQRREADALGILYRLTHELSRHVSVREISENAVKIIQQELAFKRIWLGLNNEQETHIVGEAGFGPDMRGAVLDLQIELEGLQDLMNSGDSGPEPVILSKETSRGTGFFRLFEKISDTHFVLVPMVSFGKTVGALLVEPSAAATFFGPKKLALLRSIASEVGSVVLARRFESKMADAEKMRMAGLLASGVAHNFNNLLQAIMGQASLLEMQLPKDSPLSSSAQMIIESSIKGASIIKHLLSFSMPGSSEKKSISINSMLDESAEFYKSVLGSRVDFEMRLDDDSPLIRVDSSQLQQVITNLLMNARDATQDNTQARVKVRTKKVRLRSGELGPELAPGLYLRIDVEDNGSGMDHERQSRCFEPFFTTKKVDTRTGLAFDGSGLGLSSAYSILRQHNGLITVSSRPGEGTLFSIFVPAVTVTSREEENVVKVEKIGQSKGAPQGTRFAKKGSDASQEVMTNVGQGSKKSEEM